MVITEQSKEESIHESVTLLDKYLKVEASYDLEVGERRTYNAIVSTSLFFLIYYND